MEIGRGVLSQAIPPSSSGAFCFSWACAGEGRSEMKPAAKVIRIVARRSRSRGAKREPVGAQADLIGKSPRGRCRGYVTPKRLSYRLDAVARTGIREIATVY